jgi:GTP-binding protein LepA
LKWPRLRVGYHSCSIKVDSPLARTEEVKLEIASVLNCDPDQVLEVSGRTGQGVDDVLKAMIDRVPAPHVTHTGPNDFAALVFDFEYSNHQGVIVYIRVLDGQIKKGDQLLFVVANEKFFALSVGTFSPTKMERDTLYAGEIGYIVTGIKQPGIASVGDTITLLKNPLPALAGYQNPRPVVWASVIQNLKIVFQT